MTRMPARRLGIRKRVARRPVTVPATAEAAAPARVASAGWTPATRRTAAVAAPRVIEPSVVMSATSKTRKET